MAFKVSVEHISVFPHPNADRMEIARVGDYDLVIGKGNLKDGDKVLFAPKRTVIPEELRHHYCNKDTGESYLHGPNKDRVGSIRLRGELSEGVTIAFDTVKHLLGVESIDDLPVGVDLSKKLGMTEFVAPIRASLSGDLAALSPGEDIHQHDCYALSTTAPSFRDDEDVVVTEKLHGSQINILFPDLDGPFRELPPDLNGQFSHLELCGGVDEEEPDPKDMESISHGRMVKISSKGILSSGTVLRESQKNTYWKAFRHSNIGELVSRYFGKDQYVRIIGEVIPVQKGFSYGEDSGKPTIKIFRIDVDGKTLSLDEVRQDFPDFIPMWVPVLYEGPYDRDKFVSLSKGKETVSGRELHIREGVVVSPKVPRTYSVNKIRLMAKVINPKYRDNDDDIS